jgi:hypothetical protein
MARTRRFDAAAPLETGSIGLDQLLDRRIDKGVRPIPSSHLCNRKDRASRRLRNVDPVMCYQCYEPVEKDIYGDNAFERCVLVLSMNDPLQNSYHQ